VKSAQYYFVGKRPVKAVRNSDGQVTVLAYDWASGEFQVAPEYLTRVFFPAGDPEVDDVDKDRFEQRVRDLREGKESS
jgi:hypothetical protein